MPFNSETGTKAGAKSSRRGRSNKSNSEIRALFQNLLEDNLEGIQDDLDNLEPHQRIKAILDLSKYVLPSLKSIEVVKETTNKDDQLDVSRLSTEELQYISNLYEKYY